ncbi:hypothetical protein [Ruixingdingia sedimenti]|uniref:Uncharacterized protein n=1 Tax=Ruixingdingia sedimenti TaxID=3073604 RepID=A0ABU1FF88_9RHOB|nr:hypothetical protein [Xinfangfangia sp. LG-4]MDR5655238.1 hypothetical protein [Xinfangfangia sp. LG-4]
MATRYRWIAPDGRRGRWRKSLEGAVISAVSTAKSAPHEGLKLTFDLTVSLALWPDLKAEGWSFEKGEVT